MASRIPMQVYEDTTLTHTDDHLYEPIKIDKKENNLNLSRKQWFNIFLLMLAGSLVSFGLGSTVTYFTIHSVMDLKMTNLDRGTDELFNMSISETLKMIVRERDLVIDSKMSVLEGRMNMQSTAQMLISENLKEVVNYHSKRDLVIDSKMSVLEGRMNMQSTAQMLISENLKEVINYHSKREKNNADIVGAMVHYGGSDTGHHMASASAFVQLASGDTVTIKGSRVDQVSLTSSMTIVRM
ncbi:unnamed protein product [Mytilus coruscus]|uniref:Uncharacterized protein n=1 Tax=Mytilus coruscus TaxID=42192 RepID=A0A6J8BJZ7_MYTCO|nr:unnamed protein product [Mytilus coruscus]